MASKAAFLVLVLFGGSAFGLFPFSQDQNIFLNRVQSILPSITSLNTKCKNDTLYYLQELEQLKLWATEMFDSSSKYPSGLLIGSNYNLGNYDQCVQVKVPVQGHEFNGKHCMVKFTLKPPKRNDSKKVNFELDDYANYFNITAWDKIQAYLGDETRASRNEFFLSFCIPSSCSPGDLRLILQETFRPNRNLEVTIGQKNCQVLEPTVFSPADIGFLSLISLFILLALISTTYTVVNNFRKEKQESGLKVLEPFCLVKNFTKLTACSENKDGLDCVGGIKVLSMFLILLGHRCMFTIGSPLVNSRYVELIYTKVDASVLLNGTIIVNTFLIISGFLASFLLLKELDKRPINFIQLYLHRIIRITPAYALVIAFYCTIFVQLGSGPLWQERVGVEQERCLSSWWTNLLYISNYIKTDQTCMFQSWYLACDMHYFLLTPFLVWLLHKKPIFGGAALSSLLLASISTIFFIVFLTKENGIILLYMKFLRDPTIDDTFRTVYTPSHMRATPYLVGIIAGYIKYKSDKFTFKLSKWSTVLVWILAFSIGEATLYAGYIFYLPNTKYDTVFNATYGAMHQLTWSVAIAWVILSTSCGYGEWIRPLFSCRIFTVLSRVTYSTFLVHGIIQMYTVSVIRAPLQVSYFQMAYDTSADIVTSYFAGFLLSLFVESPIIGLEKVLLKGGKGKSPKEEENLPQITIPKVKLKEDAY